MACDNCKKLEQALDVCKLNREESEKLAYDQSLTIADLRAKLDYVQSGRHRDKSSVNGVIKELGNETLR